MTESSTSSNFDALGLRPCMLRVKQRSHDVGSALIILIIVTEKA